MGFFDFLRRTPAMTAHRVQCASPAGLHYMAYTQWGDPANPRVLICVHGLTRCGRDFDFLARRLAGDFRVICPDVVGRGRSDWLQDKAGYGLPQYVADMVTLVARLDVEQVDWLGTSMGGLIGMALAAQPGNPIRRLVLNDVGPVITAASLRRIGEYLGTDTKFPDLAAAEAYVRRVSAPFGPLTDEQWQHLTAVVIRPAPGGGYEFSYDPGIAKAYKAAPILQDMALWPVYEAIRCPVLAIRGAESDLLPAAAFREMGERGPRAERVEFPGVGHAPMFLDDVQVAPVRRFLLSL